MTHPSTHSDPEWLASGVRAASSDLADPDLAVAAVMRSLDPGSLAGLILFSSSHYDLDRLSAALSDWTRGLAVIGCTTSQEIAPGGLRQGSVTAVGFPSADFTFHTARFEALDRFDTAEAGQIVRALVTEAAVGAMHLGEPRSRVALFLVDGHSHREEMLTFTLQEALAEIPLIGGSSVDSGAAETFVFHNGEFRSDAALVAILTSRRPMHVFRSHFYTPGTVKMVVTGVSSVERVVHEINARPAAREYARLVGVAVEDLGTGVFASHPPMVRAGGEYYCRSIQAANPDGSLTFSCAIDEGVVLTLGQANDIMGNFEALFDGLRAELGSVDRIIGFDCLLNSVEVAQRQLRNAVSELFSRERVVGFQSFGEQFHALHVNQNFCGLAIGR